MNEYMRMQLQEDIYGNRRTEMPLTAQQMEAITALTRPQQQSDLYDSFMHQLDSDVEPVVHDKERD